LYHQKKQTTIHKQKQTIMKKIVLFAAILICLSFAVEAQHINFTAVSTQASH
jgi:hypothetical protein